MHYIITRLNLKIDCRELNDTYLQYRMDLYELTTYKSLLNQTDQSFKHVIATSSNIPENIKKRLELLPRIDHIIYIDEETREWPTDHIQNWFKNIYIGDRYLTTTNIDSDDMLNKHWVEKINYLSGSFIEYPHLILSTNFYHYSIDKKVSKIKLETCPPSMALIEKEPPIITAWARGHNQLPLVAKEVTEIDLPFMMLMHPTNLCTREFKPYIAEKFCQIDLKDLYGINEKELIEFLSKKYDNQWIKKENKIRELRRQKSTYDPKKMKIENIQQIKPSIELEDYKIKIINPYHRDSETQIRGLCELYNDMPGIKKLVEIGSAYGESAELFKQLNPDLSVICIDPWSCEKNAQHEHDYGKIAFDQFKKRMKPYKKIKWIKEKSKDAIVNFKNESLDCVYIDANHNHDPFQQDIDIWYPKVKIGGYICGHDCSDKFPGVLQAIREVVGRDPDKIYCDTSWLIKKKKEDRIVVYTVCLNGYDKVEPPPVSPPTVDFVLFTDGDPVPGWNTIKIDLIKDTSIRRQSRFLKINSHKIEELIGYRPDITIYMDSCLKLEPDWYYKLFKIPMNDFNVCRHTDDIYYHFKKLRVLVSDNNEVQKIINQEKYYKEQQLPANINTTENCFIVRKNNDYVKNINEKWWNEYVEQSERDQPALTYIVWKNDLNIAILPFNARSNNIYSNWCVHVKDDKIKQNKLIFPKPLAKKSEPPKPMPKPVPKKPPISLADFSLIKKKEDLNLKNEEFKNIKRIYQSNPTRVCVTSIFIGPQNFLYQKCRQSIIEFANSKGYDYKEITDQYHYPHPSWSRLKIRDFLSDYDTILYVDGDVFIKNNAESPVDYYEPTSIVALDSVSTYVYMRNYPKERRSGYKHNWKRTFNEICPLQFSEDYYINAGVMLIPGKGFEHLFDEPPRILSDGNFLEQTYLNTQIEKYKYPLTHLNHRWNFGHLHVPSNLNMAVSNPNIDFCHFNIPLTHSKLEIFKDFYSKYCSGERG